MSIGKLSTSSSGNNLWQFESMENEWNVVKQLCDILEVGLKIHGLLSHCWSNESWIIRFPSLSHLSRFSNMQHCSSLMQCQILPMLSLWWTSSMTGLLWRLMTDCYLLLSVHLWDVQKGHLTGIIHIQMNQRHTKLQWVSIHLNFDHFPNIDLLHQQSCTLNISFSTSKMRNGNWIGLIQPKDSCILNLIVYITRLLMPELFYQLQKSNGQQ